jgi:hypothetical protein
VISVGATLSIGERDLATDARYSAVLIHRRRFIPVRLQTAPLTPALEDFGDLCGWSDCSYPEAVDRPPFSVFAALAVTILILAGAIYVLAFYLR